MKKTLGLVHTSATLVPMFAQLTKQYLPHVDTDPAWELIRLAWSSVADLAIAPAQDVLNLGSSARMNTPGRPTGNWRWRMTDSQWRNQVSDRLADLTTACAR